MSIKNNPPICEKCGRYKTISDTSSIWKCDCEQNLSGGLYGWLCPKCGRGNSPFTTTCPCQPLDFKITC